MANETTIGAKLRQARLDKHISLDELQQMTKVQKRYLEAIEADRFEQLPGTFYVRAFIRQYAAAVGEDGDKLVSVFDGKDTLAEPLPKRPQPETVSGSRKALHVEEKRRNVFIPLLTNDFIRISSSHYYLYCWVYGLARQTFNPYDSR